MKKIVSGLCGLTMVLGLFSGTALAKSMTGKIKSIDSKAGILEVTDGKGGGNVVVQLTAQTAYSGAASAAELRAGDHVTLAADPDPDSGKTVASFVKVSART